MIVKRVLPAWLALGLALSSAWGQKVETHYDRSADFSRYKTYAWKDRELLTRQGPDAEKQLEQSIVGAVNAQLKAKGLVETSESADLYLSYHGGALPGKHGAGEPVSARQPDLGGPFNTTIVPGSVPNVWFSVQGQIVFDFVDPKSNATVWSSSLRKNFKNTTELPKDLDRQVQQIVRKAFRDFPPKTRGK
ncbi:MAG TPA: DUF4136 domain-containing protein [Terriglobia bacterium]